MNNETSCKIIHWSRQTIGTIRPILCICLLATVNHLIFQIQLKVFPTVHKRSMLWVYAYIITDLLLLLRFFLLYIYRWWPRCIPHVVRTFICYGEAVFDNYLNQLQCYILLALNICRYLQIVHGHNVYVSNHLIIMIAYCLIYFLPFISHIVMIAFGWTLLQNPPGGFCNLLPISLIIRIAFLVFSYFIPVCLTLVFLLLSLHHIQRTDGIRAQEILDARQKYYRRLVLQSAIFYTIWLVLWSPNLLLFPFYCKNGRIGNLAKILSYINITLDPIAISALDRRFLQTWQLTGDQCRRWLRRRQSSPVPVILSTHTIEHSLTVN
ncbi:unnamed protein product [Adineta ricciae]|uniref:G-protein coupled receptors family 1 profile domain-containing protein n=1 Tax=Adineta ricciae TaxID=249248 RepID=A0A814MDX8_ADIRI|nr:unnamed protein product [Adineta ricciae]